jgi:hypothetical protein
MYSYYKNNTLDHNSALWPENCKFGIDQFDHFFSLHDLSESNSEEDKILPNTFFQEMDSDRPLSLNRLYEDEDLYLGDNSLAGLDSQTLPSLFGQSGRKHQKAKHVDKCYKLKELLWSEERLNDMSLCLCEYANIVPDCILTLSEHSPLTSLLPSNHKYSIIHIFKEVIRFTLRNIHEAIVEETRSVSQTKALLEKNVSVELNSVSINEYDELCQSMEMSDVNSSYTAKRTHKKWAKTEEIELMNLIERFGKSKIPEGKWDELAIKFDRTVCSLHAKVKSLQRKQTATLCSKEEARTYSEIIVDILNSLPNKAATKEEIISVICQRYNITKSEVEKSVLQCLAKKFERCSGIYRLKKGIELPPSKDAAKKSIKDKLIYILNELLPSGEGTLAQIRLKYQQEFPDDLDTRMSANSNQAVWEKTISKTLLKCIEFDKSKAKTKYTFKGVAGL